MIDDELRPAVIEFVTEMLNDLRCESILLDVDEDAMVDSDLPALYLDVTGKRYGCTLSILGGRVFGEHSKLWHGRNNNNSEGKRGGHGSFRSCSTKSRQDYGRGADQNVRLGISEACH